MVSPTAIAELNATLKRQLGILQRIFQEDGGLSISKFSATAILDQMVSTSAVHSSSVDMRFLPFLIVFLDNTQDVAVSVDFQVSHDSVAWFDIKENVSISAGTKQIAVLAKDRYPYFRLQLTAPSPPATGKVKVVATLHSL